MKRNAPELYPHLHYSLLEKTPLFLKEQKERLAHFEQEGRVSWIDSEAWEEGKERDRFEGCLLSNELVDAFPVHRVIFDGGVLKEIYVAEQNGQWEERWGEISDPRVATYLQSLDINLEEGQKAEVNLAALDWMERVGRCLKRGFV
jgi:SAM-dependent MidA family methyltransferase